MCGGAFLLIPPSGGGVIHQRHFGMLQVVKSGEDSFPCMELFNRMQPIVIYTQHVDLFNHMKLYKKAGTVI